MSVKPPHQLHSTFIFIRTLLVTMGLNTALAQEPVPSLPFVYPEPILADVRVATPSTTNLSRMEADSVYGGEVFQYLGEHGNETPDKFAVFTVIAETSGRYALFVANSVQGEAYTSPLTYRIDKGEWLPLPKTLAEWPRWGINNVMVWTYIGEVDLVENQPIEVEIRCKTSRKMDSQMAVYLNGVAGYRLDDRQSVQIESMQVVPTQGENGPSLVVELAGSDVGQLDGAMVKLYLNEEVVTQERLLVDKTVAPADAKAQAAIQIPFDAPGGEYRIVVEPLFFQEVSGQSEAAVEFEKGDGLNAKVNSNAIKAVTVGEDGQLLVALHDPASEDLIVGVWYLDERGYLMAAYDQPVPAGLAEVSITLAEDRWAQKIVGPLEVFVHASTAPAVSVEWSSEEKSTLSYKPMGHGTYVESNGVDHRWYITDDNALIWDGKPWIPFGGMYGDSLLTHYSSNPEVRLRQWQDRKKCLDEIQAAGLSDMYLNLANNNPIWVRQVFVDELNRRGIRFGWQLNNAGQAPECYPIRSTLNQGLIEGTVSEPGKLLVELPREQIKQLVVISTDDAKKVRSLDVDLNFDAGNVPEFIIMDQDQDAKKKTVSVSVDFPTLEPGKYYVIPRVKSRMHITDLWGHEDAVIKAHEWVRKIDWGPGFRFLIDSTGNESGIYNADESMRVWSDAFNAEYAEWLKERYVDVAALEKAWHLPGQLADFQQAARLIPLRNKARDRDVLWWVDPVEGAVFATSNGLGQGWFDYSDAVRQTYARHRDRVAAAVREWVDVPMVNKRVTPWVSDENINREVGGVTGIGVDIYPEMASKVIVGLSAGRLETMLSEQTVWMMGAELGYSPHVSNSGVRGFPSEAWTVDLTRVCAAWGMKGFMYFGLRLEPYGLWKNHHLHALPEQLRWIKKAQESIETDPPEPVVFAQAYPEGQNWWWKANGELLNRYTCVYDDSPGSIQQSVTLVAHPAEERNYVAVNGSQPMEEAELLLVNFNNAAAVERYGSYVEETIRAGKPVVYVGYWPKGASLTGLSEHFSQDGKSLLKLPGDEVLDTSRGKITAKRNNGVLILARSFPDLPANKIYPIPALKRQWLEEILAPQD